MSDARSGPGFRTSVTATLSVRNWTRAIDFYKTAFEANELYRVDGGGVAQLLPSPLPKSTLTLALPKLATARSGLPSPLRSATATQKRAPPGAGEDPLGGRASPAVPCLSRD